MIPQITIPYAVADFAEMRERGFYYVDKTDCIPELEDYKAPVGSFCCVFIRIRFEFHLLKSGE